MWVHPRLRPTAAARLGWTLPPVCPGAVWVHAASVGEGRVAEALFCALRAEGCTAPLLRTATTPAGLEAARGHDLAWPLPLDLPGAARRFVDHVRPGVLVLVESELWPELLAVCADRGVPVWVLGARVGPGLRRWARWAPGWLRGLPIAWNPRDGEDFCELLGLGLHPGMPVGDLKLEAPPPPVDLRLPRPLLIAASTRAGDEARVLDALAAGPRPWPALLLAPRQLERVPEVEALLRARGLGWSRRSALGAGAAPAVVVLDTLGELAGLMPQADAVFVGGTFDAALGGHSPAEALACGVPVVHGPCTAAHPGLYRHPLCGSATEQTLGAALRAALARPSGLPAPGTQAVDAARRVLEVLRPPPPERPLRPGLRPLRWVWRALSRFPRRVQRVPVPVVSVGGLSSGGAGKTPAVDWICRAVAQQGRRPAVVARGYRRLPAGPGVRTGEEHPGAGPLGDELELLRRRGWAVVSAPERARGAAAAVQGRADVVVLDDGFQRRDLHRDLDVVVVDADRPLGGGLLPAGDAREGPEALARADVLWVVGEARLPEGFTAALRPGALQVRARVRPVAWLHRGALHPLEALRGEICAFAGVALPGRVLRSLVALGLRPVAFRAFADHHPYTAAELEALAALAGDRPLVTTEKDLVRLPPGWPGWALRVELELLEGEDALKARLAALGRTP